jgi:multidrug efflux pump subunit AcrA (membrane-fusion protein)
MVAAVAIASPALAQAQGQGSTVIEVHTQPYKKFPVHFMRMGKISEVNVKLGDVVKKGDQLMKQDTSVEESELAILKFDAENLSAVKAAEKKFKLAELEFKMKERLYQSDKGRELEYERAKAEMEVAAVQVEQAKTELEQKKLKFKQQEVVVKNMTLRADSDGIVQELTNDLGSTVDPTHPSLVILQNSPVQAVLRLPSAATLTLKPGDKLRASYDKKNWREATVSFLSAEADAMTELSIRTIYLDLPNPEGVPAGLQAYVEVPDKLLAAGAKAGNADAANAGTAR